MSGTGQNAKYSSRVDVFRFALDNGHAVTAPPRPFRANSRREQVPLRSERSRRRPADRSDKQSLGNEQIKNGHPNNGSHSNSMLFVIVS
jgi:hypothetical protein